MRQFWVRKYAPESFEDYCFTNPAAKKQIVQLLKTNDIPHLLLTGAPGTGKSTLARLLIDSVGIDPVDVLTIDASLENNVDVVRDKIKTFVTTSSFDSPVKVVLLEEFDHMSTQAQSTLREMMVRYSDDARFILTANYLHKIIDAIVSRCQHIVFDALPKSAAIKRLVDILDSENVVYTIEDVELLVNRYLPDLRRIINIAQQHTIDGKLVIGATAKAGVVSQYLSDADFAGLLSWLIGESTANDHLTFYSDVFNNLENCESIASEYSKIDKAIVAIAKYQSQHITSADPIICMAALVSELRLISKGTI